jgi:putative endonuclease
MLRILNSWTNTRHPETSEDVHGAISREKEIKGWLRSKKLALIESTNPTWKDVSVSLL